MKRYDSKIILSIFFAILWRFAVAILARGGPAFLKPAFLKPAFLDMPAQGRDQSRTPPGKEKGKTDDGRSGHGGGGKGVAALVPALPGGSSGAVTTIQDPRRASDYGRHPCVDFPGHGGTAAVVRGPVGHDEDGNQE